jgi:hypothetical protein
MTRSPLAHEKLGWYKTKLNIYHRLVLIPLGCDHIEGEKYLIICLIIVVGNTNSIPRRFLLVGCPTRSAGYFYPANGINLLVHSGLAAVSLR